MGDDSVERFPIEKARKSTAGAPAQAATVESDLDPGNPFEDSLRGLLRKRRKLIDEYGDGDGAVWDVERRIADRLVSFVGDE
ncbi:hypothetical protein [Reyranella sp.]|uniref:hypothetical protein n=1 Tax=Reyranella sp. TaxID=1929291 RepID=UPI001203AF54|nr:hypothetical protein [Reyranella sp.]TAJ89684.1 MAG: hypothetical protein EPO50_04795 [Reyranella sp.]